MHTKGVKLDPPNIIFRKLVDKNAKREPKPKLLKKAENLMDSLTGFSTRVDKLSWITVKDLIKGRLLNEYFAII